MKMYVDIGTRDHPADLRAGDWFGRVHATLAGVREGYLKARRRRQAIRDLRSLSDRVLNDIGIDRSQIPEVVDGMLARNHGTGASVSHALNAPEPAVRCHQGCAA